MNSLPPSHEVETDYYSRLVSANVMLKKVQTTYQAKTQGPHLALNTYMSTTNF